MVFFTCNACGESIKKNQVEKHYHQQCSNCEVLSCVDCGKEFWGDSYAQHTKCMTEDEKFGGKNYKPKPNANKGEQKQQLWVQQVQEAISKSKTNPKLQDLLERLKEYPNIPRKKAKFENFLCNSLRIRDSRLATQAWDAISAETENKHMLTSTIECVSDASNTAGIKDKNKNEVSADVNESTEAVLVHNIEKKFKGRENNFDTEMLVKNVEGSNGKERKKRKRQIEEELPEETEKKEPKKKKSKAAVVAEEKEDNLPDIDSQDEAASGTFKWEAAIIGILKRTDENQMSVKKLRKKVFGEYNARGGDGKSYTEEQLLAKFTKKISKNPRLKVLKDIVRLVN